MASTEERETSTDGFYMKRASESELVERWRWARGGWEGIGREHFGANLFQWIMTANS